MQGRIFTVLMLSFLVGGCAALKGAARLPVDGANKNMVHSNFTPEDHEGCRELGNKVCPYFNNPLKSVRDSCVAHVLPDANAAAADYIFVAEPSTSVGGFNTKSPKATWYQCSNLDKK